jgi:2-dehydropantoate 2-reductase
LDGVEQPDLIVIGVKSYSLPEVLDKIEDAFGNQVPVMSVLNGVSHVKLVSERFERALFATIIFNAYRTSPSTAVAIGGSLGLSAKDPKDPLIDVVFKLLKRKISVSLLDDPMDAAHCKLIINLGNALLTLVAFHEHRNREIEVLQRLTSQILNEGVDVLKKSGVKEAKISGMPPWLLIRLSKLLPSTIIVPIFKKKLQTNNINSMAQDIAAGSSKTELEDINGYFLQIAEKVKVDVPFNKGLYHTFKVWIENGAQPFTPSDLEEKIKSFSSL